MFTILVPVLAIPIMLTLGIGMRKSKSDVKTHVVPRAADGSAPSLWQKTVSVFWSLDVIGLLLMVAGFGALFFGTSSRRLLFAHKRPSTFSAGMVLCTVTIANGKGSKWSDGTFTVALERGGGRFEEIPAAVFLLHLEFRVDASLHSSLHRSSRRRWRLHHRLRLLGSSRRPSPSHSLWPPQEPHCTSLFLAVFLADTDVRTT